MTFAHDLAERIQKTQFEQFPARAVHWAKSAFKKTTPDRSIIIVSVIQAADVPSEFSFDTGVHGYLKLPVW